MKNYCILKNILRSEDQINLKKIVQCMDNNFKMSISVTVAINYFVGNESLLL